ncbi:MAG: prepilin-type N-terminal cleavage/methylation domain-containing protein, partial [Lachnospiraceae bacterium]|nr:prepilin-type N-terminal cleavage/methylation domain-containing protein [Lachnospiraceae bacterium]
MKRRDNNRGFTLVELVIAVAILAIAILPLFSNFVQSAKMNLKGRKNLNAMNLAQDMMEGMSAYKGAEIDNVIRAAGSDPTKLAGTILPKAAKCSSITVKTGAEWAYADATATKPDITKPFGYVFKDVETVVNETHNKYDVELILDPTGTDQEKYNNREVTGDMDVNQFYDAVFTMPINEVEEAVKGLKSMSSDQSIDESEYYGKIRRTTIISVLNSGTETEPNYRVSVRREYRPLNPVALGLSGSIVWYDEAVNISKLEANKLPRSVYFYFEGMQNANKTDKIHENIQILNKTGQDINIYLLRTQKVD